MKWLFLVLFAIIASTHSLAEEIPLNAIKYVPILQIELDNHWKDFKDGSYIAGQIEQETCISLTHSKCWSPFAELKTDREYGFGLGQFTITNKFNKFTEVQSIHPTLRNWEWNDRYNAEKQLRGIVILDNLLHKRIYWTDSRYNKIAFMLSAYNGGYGNLLNDKELCKSNSECDERIWFGNVEYTSWRNRTKLPGYGKSFFDINREYVKNIFAFRSQKYRFMDN